jgi:hypothetical protein
METHETFLEQEFYKTLTEAYEWLFSVGKEEGNWKNIEGTSMAALCLNIREPKSSPWIVGTRDWLLEQQIEMSPELGSWEEELWQTTTAIIALSKLGVPNTHPKMKKGLNFIHKLYNTTGRSNWEDEPWETSWAIWAIAESSCKDYLEDAVNGMKWLMSLQDESGRIISPHYTAYFIKIANSLCKRQLVSEGDHCEYERTVERAREYLLAMISKESLWTGVAWSNGQILWSLTSTDNFPFDDDVLVSSILTWFAKNQEPKGNWYDAEDTASSILGLVYLLRGYKIETVKDKSDIADIDTTIYSNLRRRLETPKYSFGKRFIQVLDDGTTTLNFSPRVKRTAIVLFAVVSGLTVFFAVWDFIREMLGI